MDISELKQLLKNSTSVLIMENGNPDLVVMEYRAYKQLAQGSTQETSQHIPTKPVASSPRVPLHSDLAVQSREAEILERLNREIMTLKEQIEAEERGTDPQSPSVDF